MLTKERIAEFRAAPNSISPLDFVLLCQQAEEAIDLLAKVNGDLSEKHASIPDSETTEETT